MGGQCLKEKGKESYIAFLSFDEPNLAVMEDIWAFNSFQTSTTKFDDLIDMIKIELHGELLNEDGPWDIEDNGPCGCSKSIG
jgi:hypothetical protein